MYRPTTPPCNPDPPASKDIGVPEHERPAVDLIARLMGEDLGNQRLQQSSNLHLNPVFGIIRCDDIQLVMVEIPPGTEW